MNSAVSADPSPVTGNTGIRPTTHLEYSANCLPTVRSENNTSTIAASPVEKNSESSRVGQTQSSAVGRPRRDCLPPARYRRLRLDSAVSNRLASVEFTTRTTEKFIINSNSSRVNRRNRERGLWFCADCNRPPMMDITTFRRHGAMDQHGYEYPSF